ncbi:glucosaminidase domain-containing protein [Burkholderia sp. 9777_1386]|uniref:glycoside hydrolase family 73 protein n=1 Tax=Burkholderia sp. 9777_1386 TaxID=2751183 RepID=UPI0018C425E3|nr:glucosaminidase domain-containing protein [Burkholderia sp. 9777_1386]MBG0871895.1 glucosaminidase domain-containing protein [Burkholderia sp. 9777_1386]
MGLSNLIRAILALFGRVPASAQAEPQPAAPAEAPVAPAAPVVETPQPAPPLPAVPAAPVVPIPVTPPRAAEPAPDISTPAGFIAAIAPAAQACAKRTGVPASVTVAQAALESSWGRRAPGMNLFGIKADASWRGPVTSQPTHEVVNGQTITITANFRAYSTWQGSIDDHAAFLTGNPRYRPAFACKTGPEFARAIAAAGYATDPQYADKLISIMNARGLCALDSLGVPA